MKNSTAVLIAAGLAVGSFAIYNAIQRRRECAPVYYVQHLSGNYNAKTIPPFGIFILESERDNAYLLAHELVHWKQYQEQGLIPFYWNYFNELSMYGYDNMPMELEARYLENEYCRNNYTECVRNGQAITVHNPNFRM
jgi:hypothetical protein